MSEANKAKGAMASGKRGDRSSAASKRSDPRPSTALKETPVHVEIEGGAKEAVSEGGGLRARGAQPGKSAVTASSSSVLSGTRSMTGSSSIIRPAHQTYGRAPRRADPVSAYKKTLEKWQHAPAVTAGGTARSSVGQIAALQEPEVIGRQKLPINLRERERDRE